MSLLHERPCSQQLGNETSSQVKLGNLGEKTAKVKQSPQLPQQSLRRCCLLTSEHSNKNSMERVYRSVTARSTVTPRATTLPRRRERTDSMVSCVTAFTQWLHVRRDLVGRQNFLGFPGPVVQCAGLGESCILLLMLGFPLETVILTDASPVIHGALFIFHPVGSAGSKPLLCTVNAVNGKGFRTCLYESGAWAEANGKLFAYRLVFSLYARVCLSVLTCGCVYMHEHVGR